MTNSINSLHSKFWKWILYGFAAIVLSYGILRVLPIMKGVTITLHLPEQNEIYNDSFVLSGVASHARTLSINGRTILIDPSGEFSDEVILSPGVNKIMIVAEDVRGNLHTKEFVMTGSESIATRSAPAVASIFSETDTY